MLRIIASQTETAGASAAYPLVGNANTLRVANLDASASVSIAFGDNTVTATADSTSIPPGTALDYAVPLGNATHVALFSAGTPVVNLTFGNRVG